MTYAQIGRCIKGIYEKKGSANEEASRTSNHIFETCFGSLRDRESFGGFFNNGSVGR